MKHSSELMGDAIQRVRRHWKQQSTAGFTLPPGEVAAPTVSVAISREAGALGNQVARLVGERLAWNTYDHELVDQIAEETGLRKELLDSVDEKDTSWLTDFVEAFSGAKYVSSTAYVSALVQVLGGLSAHGECVIVGHGAVSVLPRERTLRVRLVAARSDRIQRIRERHDWTEKEASQYIDKTDKERIGFVRNHFQKDEGDPCLYDLILNSSRFTSEQCAQLIVEAVGRFQANLKIRPAEGGTT